MDQRIHKFTCGSGCSKGGSRIVKECGGVSTAESTSENIVWHTRDRCTADGENTRKIWRVYRLLWSTKMSPFTSCNIILIRQYSSPHRSDSLWEITDTCDLPARHGGLGRRVKQIDTLRVTELALPLQHTAVSLTRSWRGHSNTAVCSAVVHSEGKALTRWIWHVFKAQTSSSTTQTDNSLPGLATHVPRWQHYVILKNWPIKLQHNLLTWQTWNLPK